MGQGNIPAGRTPPWDINVVVEIPLRSSALLPPDVVGRGSNCFARDAQYYPGNYGFVPRTVMPDGEPCEVLVVGSVSVLPGAILRSRPIGALVLTDAQGAERTRVLAVPLERLHPFFAGTTSCNSLPTVLLDQVARFFLSFRDLDLSPLVGERSLRVARWEDAEAAALLVKNAIESHRLGQESEVHCACR